MDDAQALAHRCALLADERKAEAIVVLGIGELSSFTDYFVIATARNPRQLSAIAEEIRQRMKEEGHTILGIEGEPEAGWVLIDLGDTIVHLFDPTSRALYDLELLWGEAPRTDWQAPSPDETTQPEAAS